MLPPKVICHRHRHLMSEVEPPIVSELLKVPEQFTNFQALHPQSEVEPPNVTSGSKINFDFLFFLDLRSLLTS